MGEVAAGIATAPGESKGSGTVGYCTQQKREWLQGVP